MKLQHPSSNIQRNTGFQTRDTNPGKREGSSGKVPYPVTEGTLWALKEGPPGTDGRHPFDLEERTALFAEAIIKFVKKLPRGPANDRLIDQIVGCATSIGANYCEANEGISKKDFHCIIGRCVKEAKETKCFLRMIAASEPSLAAEARELYREAKELHLIFATIFRKTKI
jgi:four helix bundle protein